MRINDKITLYRYINELLDFWADDNDYGEPLKIVNQCWENACSFYCGFKRKFTNKISIKHGGIFVNGDKKTPIAHCWNIVSVGKKDLLIDITKIYMERLGIHLNYEYKENINGYYFKHNIDNRVEN